MQSPLLIRPFLTSVFALALIGLCSPAAMAQSDPPGRVARLNHASGSVTFSPAGDNEWTDAQPNRPLVKGDRIWTDRGSRAEIQIGSAAIRLDGRTRVEIVALDDQVTQLSVTEGSIDVRVRSLPDGENFEIDTPNLAYRAAYPGDYRIDVDASDGTTRVTIHSGTGVVYGEDGHTMPLGGGQQVTFRARSLAPVAIQESPPQDAFDKWSAERNRLEDQSITARYVPREVVGYQQLDAYGQWRKDARHGAVWFPQGTPAGWAPYRDGRWEWIAPWGWTWIDDAPWGFAPFHYGRWALLDSQWAWVPGQLGLRPVYAPALVAFVGNSDKGILTSLAGQSGVAWFPLAPGEMWQPGFRASGAYISSVNRNMVPGSSDAAYAYQRRPEALTVISGADFQRGRPAGASWLRIAANTLTSASVVPPPAMPVRLASSAPSASPSPTDVQRLNAEATAARTQALALQDQRAKQAQHDEAVARESAAKAEAKRRETKTRQIEAAKRAAAVARAESARRERVQAVQRERQPTRARQAQLARRQQQAKRQPQTQVAEAARRDASARRTKRLRLAAEDHRKARLQQVAHDQQVERARRAAEHDAQVLREQRMRREAQARREADERERVQRQQQDREEQLRQERARLRPDLRDPQRPPPEVWQRGIPILNPGPTS